MKHIFSKKEEHGKQILCLGMGKNQRTRQADRCGKSKGHGRFSTFMAVWQYGFKFFEFLWINMDKFLEE
jgi:hypothetical protein